MSGFEVVQPAGPRRREMELAEHRQQAAQAAASIRLSAVALLRMQTPQGYWNGKLTADSTLESDYILLELWIHPPEGSEWNPPHRSRVEKACRSILKRQLNDGGWETFTGGGAEVNATARAYVALKICGYDPQRAEMARAREKVLALGGLQACNSYTKINLSQ